MRKLIIAALLLGAIGCSKQENSAPPADTSLSNGSPGTPSSSAPGGVVPAMPNGTVPAKPPLSPSETVDKICDALRSGDTDAYLKMVSYQKWRNYQASPRMLLSTFAFWSTQKPTIKVLSQSVEGASATVVYRLVITGSQPVNTVDSSNFVLENGMWKYDR